MIREKVYVKVNADHNSNGTCRPNSITFDNGKNMRLTRLNIVVELLPQKLEEQASVIQ